jgi:hypothetical protein
MEAPGAFLKYITLHPNSQQSKFNPKPKAEQIPRIQKSIRWMQQVVF